MRALLSWDIDRNDPDFHRILFDLAAQLPAGAVHRLTSYASLIDPITTPNFNVLHNNLRQLASHYDGRLYYVLSLQPSGAIIRGKWRPEPAGLLAGSDDNGGGT